jgi:hypothetical protein
MFIIELTLEIKLTTSKEIISTAEPHFYLKISKEKKTQVKLFPCKFFALFHCDFQLISKIHAT